MRIMFATLLIAGLSSCDNKQDTPPSNPSNPGDPFKGNTFIADYEIAKETVLRKIPIEYINKAREELHVAYQHTSHGTHVSFGVFGLQDYKQGDDILFAVSNKAPTAGKLDFNDNVLKPYAAPGDDASDLSRNETAFIQATRNFFG